MSIESSANLEDRWIYSGRSNSKAHYIDESLTSLCKKHAWFYELNLLSSPHADNRCKKCEAKRLKIQAKLDAPSQAIKDVITQLINNSAKEL
jgi:hypothetical protein